MCPPAISTGPAHQGEGAWETSGHILGTAQGRFRTGSWWRLGVQAELLCSEPYGKFEQGLSKQHGSLLGICNWDSLKCDVESASEVNFG